MFEPCFIVLFEFYRTAIKCYEVLGNGESANVDMILAMPVKNKDGKRADAKQEQPKEETRKPKPGRKMRF